MSRVRPVYVPAAKTGEGKAPPQADDERRATAQAVRESFQESAGRPFDEYLKKVKAQRGLTNKLAKIRIR